MRVFQLFVLACVLAPGGLGLAADPIPHRELRLTQSEWAFADQAEREDVWLLRSGAALGVAYRLDPNGPLDPRMALTLEYPWTLRYMVSASLLRDPVVLRFSLAFSDALDSGPAGLSLNLSTGVIANDLISFGLGSSLKWVVGAIGFPAATLSLSTGYTLNAEAQQELSARTSFAFVGGESRVGFVVQLSGLLRKHPQGTPDPGNCYGKHL